MKKVTLFISLIIPIFVYTQTMNVHLNDDTVDRYSISDIDSITFTIHSTEETVTDIDGHEYSTVTICDQVWMAENLKVTHYRNGDPIPKATDGTEWSTLTTGAYCNYNNDDGNADIYGSLYNWHAVNDFRGLAPEGWHVPSDAEWQTLIDCLGGSAIAGGKMKEIGTEHWAGPNEGSTNESGFTALPGGFRLHPSDYFYGLTYWADFWSFTEYDTEKAYYRAIFCNSLNVSRDCYTKQHGFSIRCVKD